MTDHPNAAPPASAGPSSPRFSDLHCDMVDYEFRAAEEKFDLEGFSKPFREQGRTLESGVAFAATFSAKNPQLEDYHVHLQWYRAGNEIKLTLGYYGTVAKVDEKNEEEPFAEHVMAWLGGFFKAETSVAQIHAAFSCPAAKWRFSLFPLPITLGEDTDLAIDGVSLNLRGKPFGVSQAWFLSQEEESRVMLYGQREVQFKTFDIHEEISGLSTCVKLFVREVGNDRSKK